MPDETSSKDTVAIDETVHEIYKQLTDESSVLAAPFRTMKDVFMWAVYLGVQQERRRPLTGKRLPVFRWAQFDSQVDIPMLKAVAIADSDDVDVLLKRNDILAIAEEYANVGIYELRDAVLNGADQPLWNLVSLIS